MESQNPEQLTQENSSELNENLNLSDTLAENENHDTLENNSFGLHSSFEPSVDEFNNASVAQQFAGKPINRTPKAICWDKVNNKPVDCP